MELIDYLKKEPRARERANKNRAIGNLCRDRYFPNSDLNKNKMEDMVGRILLMDRQWRKILEENPELRGSDYKDKDILEQQAQINLGYEVNYNSNVAKLKTL